MRANARGALAHLVERNVRNVKVRGSSPLCSTTQVRSIARLVGACEWPRTPVLIFGCASERLLQRQFSSPLCSTTQVRSIARLVGACEWPRTPVLISGSASERLLQRQFSSPLCSTTKTLRYEKLLINPLSLAAVVGRLWCDTYRYRCTRTRCCGPTCCYADSRGRSTPIDPGCLCTTREHHRYVPAHAHHAYHYYRGDAPDARHQSVPRSASRCCRFCAVE